MLEILKVVASQEDAVGFQSQVMDHPVHLIVFTKREFLQTASSCSKACKHLSQLQRFPP